MRRDSELLEDILDAAGDIAAFTAGLDLTRFVSNRMTRYATVQRLVTIGEAASRLSDELRSRHSNIPWAGIIGFRNILVHAYFGVKWDIVWEAASNEVPLLAAQIRAIAGELRDAE